MIPNSMKLDHNGQELLNKTLVMRNLRSWMKNEGHTKLTQNMKAFSDLNEENKIQRHRLQADKEDRRSKKLEIDQMDTKHSALVKRCWVMIF